MLYSDEVPDSDWPAKAPLEVVGVRSDVEVDITPDLDHRFVAPACLDNTDWHAGFNYE